MRRRHLIVFAREPRLGAVKRRLAAGIGPVAAVRWYRHALATTLRRLHGGGRWQRHLAVTPDLAADRFPWPRSWCRRPQGNGDLGRRMARALHAVPPGPAVLVGSDIPGLAPHHIEAAFRALEGGAEVVFGPAVDGGFWLVGVRRRRRLALFDTVRWSTAHALADSVAALPGGVPVALVATLADVDTAADLLVANTQATRRQETGRWVTGPQAA